MVVPKPIYANFYTLKPIDEDGTSTIGKINNFRYF